MRSARFDLLNLQSVLNAFHQVPGGNVTFLLRAFAGPRFLRPHIATGRSQLVSRLFARACYDFYHLHLTNRFATHRRGVTNGLGGHIATLLLIGLNGPLIDVIIGQHVFYLQFGSRQTARYLDGIVRGFTSVVRSFSPTPSISWAGCKGSLHRLRRSHILPSDHWSHRV